MIFWILQILFDAALLVVAGMWILSRKRVQALEQILLKLETRAAIVHVSSPVESALVDMPKLEAPQDLSRRVPNVNVPSVPFPSNTLLERRSAQDGPVDRSVSYDAYERAGLLLSRKIDLKEISKQTGLSMAELQLIGKVSQRTQ